MNNQENHRRHFIKQISIGSALLMTPEFTKAALINKKREDTLCFGETGASRYLKGIYRPEYRVLKKATPLKPIINPPDDFNINGVFLQQSSNSILANNTINYHWFDGDGKPCAIIFKEGLPKMVSRYIQTSKLQEEKKIKEEQDKGKLTNAQAYKKTSQGLYGPININQSFNAIVNKKLHLKNTANTDFFWHKPSNSQKGSLVATWYANTEKGKLNKDWRKKSPSAYSLTPQTLETLDGSVNERDDFRKRLSGTNLRGAPAHVKHDRRTNEAYFLDHHLHSNSVNIGKVSSLDGSISQLSNTLDLGRKIFFHDWFMSEIGVIIPATPFGPDRSLAIQKLKSNQKTQRRCFFTGEANAGKDIEPSRTLVLDEDSPSFFYFVARKSISKKSNSSQVLMKEGDIVKFKSPKVSFISHTINSWVDSNGDLILIASRMRDPAQSPEQTKKRFGLNSPSESPKMLETQFACDLYYWKLPLSELNEESIIRKNKDQDEALNLGKIDHFTSIKEEGLLLNIMNDFPRVNPNYLGYPSQFAYIAINSTSLLPGEEHNKLRFDKLMKIDLFDLVQNPRGDINHSNMNSFFDGENHKLLSFSPDSKSIVFGGEAAFIFDKKNSTSEDEGHLVHIIYDDGTQTDSSDPEAREPICQCRVYNARSFKEVGRWELPIRVAAGAHTTWIPGHEL